MKKKKPFVPNKNHFYIFSGLLLALFCLALCLNTGVVARFVSTPFTYAFGNLAYLFYLFFIFVGFYLVFRKKFFRIKIGAYFFATLILLVAAFMYYAHFVSLYQLKDSGSFLGLSTNDTLHTVSFMDAHKKAIDSIPGGYWKVTSLGLCPELSSGIVGYFLVGFSNNLFSVSFGGLIAAILFSSIAVGLYILPSVLKAIGQSKEKKIKKTQQKDDGETISDISLNRKNQTKVKNIDVVKGAKEFDPEQYESEIVGTPRRNNVSSFVGQNNGSVNFSIGENSMFAPARFVANAPHVEEIRQPVEPVQPVEQTPQVEQKVEQLSLDFNAKPEINQELVQAKPVFEEPVVMPSPAPTPVMPPPVMQETPKPRERVKWIQPSTEVLNTYETSEQLEINRRVADERKELINIAFSDFGVGAQVEDYTIGPSITRFNIKYNHNVSSRSVANLIGDIQIRLSGVSARFESVVEGQSTSGLEIPNASVTTVSFKDVYEALPDVKKHPLAVAFGKNIKGDVIAADFDEFPHILIAGTTGSGKSIFVNSIIVTLIMRNSPDDLKLVLVDPKKVEMSRYKDMPHLLCPIITEPVEAKNLIERLCKEMEERYALFSENGSTNIKEFNEDAVGLGLEKLPYIVVVLDEYADIVDQCKEISMPVVSLAQKARACGIHLLISTQRPSTNVVTGVIKANLPTHVALMTASSTDSVTIIGEGGAEKLIGKGDMLVQSPLVSRVGVVRLQGCFIHRQEISRVVGYLKDHYETHYDEKFLNLEQESEQAANEYSQTPEFKESAGNSEEDRYQAIKEWVMTQEFMSISRIQRECAVGFNRAGRFFLRLQSEGVVGNETEGNKGCRVLVQDKFVNSDSGNIATSDEQTSFRSDD